MAFSRERFEPVFRAEADGLLERMERALGDLRRGPAGDDLLAGMARDAHTLRGSATMMGHLAAAGLARLVEESLDRARAVGGPLGAARLELLDECLRALRSSVECGAETGDIGGGLAERAARLFGAGAPRPARKGRGR